MGNTTDKLTCIEKSGNEFIRCLVHVILDEWKIVGNGDFMKRNHSKIVDFKYPDQLESLFNFQIEATPTTQADLLDICRKTIAYSIKTNHPHFINSLFGGVDQYGVAGSWLTDALNCTAATYENSPVFTMVERHTIEFMGTYTGFKEVDGLFCPGGSLSNGYSMLLARHRLYPDIKEHGLVGKKKLITFVSDQAHYSFSKMAILLGHGTDSVFKVKTDETGHMIPEELEKRIQEAKKKSFEPFLVVGTSGTTILGAFDPLPAIGEICKKHKLWFHVDAATGGAWLFSTKHRTLLKGLETADSITWDLHKMTSVPIYCSLFLVNKKNLLDEALNLQAEYLFQESKFYDKEYDLGDKSIQCTRKIEAFKLFLFLKAHGATEIEQAIDNVFDMARYFEKQISTRPNFRLLFPKHDSNNVCFYFIPDKYKNITITPSLATKITTELKRRMTESGTMMVSYQTIEVKKITSCFRLTISALPIYTKTDMDYFINEFERLGVDISFDD